MIGTYAAGGTVSSSFVTAARPIGVQPVFQTFVLGSGWTGLSSVQLIHPLGAFDNVVVPEPSTVLLLLASGVAGLAMRRRRLH